MQDQQHKSKYSRVSNKTKKIFAGRKLPLMPTVLVGFVIVVTAFLWGNKLPLLNLSDLGQIGHHANVSGQVNWVSVKQLYSKLSQYYDGNLSGDELTVGLEKGLINATGDPHTEFFTASEAEAFNNSINGDYSGIGVEVSQKSGRLTIVALVNGDTPARRAGLMAGDVITHVDNKDISQTSLDVAVSKIQGKPGTSVKLTIIRGSKTLNKTVTRASIHVPSVTSTIINGNIGYMQLNSFGDDTVDLATKAANNFKSKKVKGVILDLRNNGGGELDAAVGVSSLWLNNDQVIVSEKTGGQTTQTLHASGSAPLTGIPTIVLVNGGTASASEITSGALHDNGMAKLLGEQTYGKGSVQQEVNLRGGGVLKVTVAHWYTPDGINIGKKGLKPDIELKLTDAEFNAGQDTQKTAAIKLLEK